MSWSKDLKMLLTLLTIAALLLGGMAAVFVTRTYGDATYAKRSDVKRLETKIDATERMVRVLCYRGADDRIDRKECEQ